MTNQSNFLEVTGTPSLLNRFLFWVGGHPELSLTKVLSMQMICLGSLQREKSFHLPRQGTWLSLRDPAGVEWEILARKNELKGLNLHGGNWSDLERPPLWRSFQKVFQITWRFFPLSITWKHLILVIGGLFLFEGRMFEFLKTGGGIMIPPLLYWLTRKTWRTWAGHYLFSLRLELAILTLSTISQTWLLREQLLSLRLLLRSALELLS